MKKFALSLLAFTAISTNSYANVPVIDGTLIARAAQSVGLQTQQLAQLQQVYQTGMMIHGAIGQRGAGNIMGLMGPAAGALMGQLGMGQSGALKSAYDAYGSTIASGIAGAVGGNPNWAAIAGNTVSGIAGAQGGGRGVRGLTQPTADGFSSARGWTANTFYGDSPPDADGRAQLEQRRLGALRGAAVDGYALSMSTRRQIANTATIAQGLEQAANSSTDLRSDVRVNTLTLLQIYTLQTQQLAALNQLVEIEASTRINSDSQLVRGN